MRILLTGPTGQVGSALLETLPSLGEVIPSDRSCLDLANPDSICNAVRSVRPQVIVNAAAYTAVEQAEREEALAFRINGHGVGILAEEAKKAGAFLVHFSSDYVFDGEKPTPYVETDPPNPLNAYGRSKLAGEQAIQAAGCRHIILRTSWVYSQMGKNFLLTMLALARQGKAIRVVDDQYGAPTSNLMIAAAIPKIVRGVLSDVNLDGIYHLTAAGHTTWYNFARAIFKASDANVELSATLTSDYLTAAQRPRNSRLSTEKLMRSFDVQLPSWDSGLVEVLRLVRGAT